MPNPGATKQLIDAALLATYAGLLSAGGTVFYVNSGSANKADTTSAGRSPSQPFATLDYAIGQCTASVGDVIIVAAGHAETITAAAGVNLDVAGVTIIGQGHGTNRPTFTFGTNTTATFAMAAANCKIQGLRFVSNVDSLAVFVTVGADFCTIEDCRFLGASTKEVLCGVSITTTFDYTTIKGCHFIQPTDPAGTNGGAGTGCIYLVDSEHVRIENCHFYGAWETAFVHNKTTAALDLQVINCTGILPTTTSDALPFVFVSTASGGVVDCAITNANEAATTEATLSGTFGASMFNFRSYFGNDGGGGQLGIASQSAAS